MSADDVLAARAQLFGTVFIIVQHLTRRADPKLADLGITTRQWLLLAVLVNAFGETSPSLSEAAEKYGSSRQNIKQIALGLEARGFVRLVADPTDARTTRIELTERVREFDQPPMAERTTTMLEDVFAGLTPDETRDLRDLAHRWLDGLSSGTSRDEGSA